MKHEMIDLSERLENFCEDHDLSLNEGRNFLMDYALRRLEALDRDRNKNGKTRKTRKKKARGLRQGSFGYARKPK